MLHRIPRAVSLDITKVITAEGIYQFTFIAATVDSFGKVLKYRLGINQCPGVEFDSGLGSE